MEVKPNRTIRTLFDNMSEFVVHVSGNVNAPVTQDAMRLRHDVFCVERNFEEQDISGLESDDYDANSYHIVLYCAKTAAPLGCTRLVSSEQLPTENYILQDSHVHPRRMQRHSVAEVSRMLISKDARNGLPFLMLASAMITTAEKLGFTSIYACMEEKLSRRLSLVHGIELNQVSETFDYRGSRAVYALKYKELHDLMMARAMVMDKHTLLDQFVVFNDEPPGRTL